MAIACIVLLGAGPTPNHRLEKRLKNLARESLALALKLHNENLKRSSVDIATLVAAFLENAPITNAGTGSEVNLKGEIECDASVVFESDQCPRCFGSIAAMPDIKNPVLVCKHILETQLSTPMDTAGLSAPVFLAGSNARDYAVGHGFMQGSLETPESKTRHAFWTQKINTDVESGEVSPYTDTIGVIVIDETSMAACSSSGGPILKHPGRVGPAAIVGAGCEIADGTACVTSGFGEDILATRLALRSCEMADSLERLEQEVPALVRMQKTPYYGSICARRNLSTLSTSVSITYSHTTESMIFGVCGVNETKVLHSKSHTPVGGLSVELL